MAVFLKGALLVALSVRVVSGIAVSEPQGNGFGDDGWYKYVRSPSNTTLRAQSVLLANVTGNVTNPNGLLGKSSSPTILTHTEGDVDIPTLVVDFGQNVVGIVSIDFAGSSNLSAGLPGLKLAFSETQKYLTNVSDFTRSDNMAAVS